MLIDHVVSPDSTPLYPHWRGRLGLTGAEVTSLYSTSLLAVDPITHSTKKSKKARIPLGETLELIFIDYEGNETNVTAFEGESIMVCALLV